MTMKATSNPSSKTALKATTKGTPSRPVLGTDGSSFSRRISRL
jgi:hypothetical protein